MGVKLLPWVNAFYVLQSAQSARAENQALALVLSCIDFRFLKSELSFLTQKNLGNQYDWTALAGASLALADFPIPLMRSPSGTNWIYPTGCITSTK